MPINVEELPLLLERMRRRIEQARAYVNFEHLQERIETLETQAARPDFWDDPTVAQKHMQQLNALKRRLHPWLELEQEVADALELLEMAESDPAMQAELAHTVEQLQRWLEKLETRALLSGPEDTNDAYLTIHAGAGGTESCDWAQMLLRMFTRYFERSEFQAETIDLQEGEEAGIRSVTLQVKGDFAYGMLKGESGVHRLVRISPFDAAKRRHTSFCSVFATPVIDDAIEIELRDEDLKIDTYRASGAGGQHVNKTSSAIRITHVPTKIVVQCQNERSQHQNKAVALKMLRSRLYQVELEQREAEQAAREGEKTDIAWGNQIRSYVFQPYQMVKDHRTGQETGNVQAVMDGDIEPFIEAYLRWHAGMPSAPAGDAATPGR